MEDYHVAQFITVHGRELGLFAIYDGHLGDSVPAYLQKHLFPNILKDVSSSLGAIIVSLRWQLSIISNHYWQKSFGNKINPFKSFRCFFILHECWLGKCSLTFWYDILPLLKEEFWSNPRSSIFKAYEKTDQAILSHSPDLGRGGSTAVTAILINGQKLWVANVGDSRAVLSKKGQEMQMSVDHEPNAERESIEDRGGFVSNMPGLVMH